LLAYPFDLAELARVMHGYPCSLACVLVNPPTSEPSMIPLRSPFAKARPGDCG
jgi:glutamate-1-semialdehyde aminotransferase